MQELGIQNFLEFLLGTIFIVLLPGPNSLYVLTASAQRGHRSGWAAAFGIFSGDTLLMIATASGAASLMTVFPRGFEAFKAMGALYLAWIGLQLLKEGWRRWPRQRVDVGAQEMSAQRESIDPTDPIDRMAGRDSQTEGATAGGIGAAGLRVPYFKALGLSLTNPKAILFFLAFFTQFVRVDATSPALAYLTLGIVVQIVSLAYLTLLIFAGLRLQSVFETHPRWSSSGIVVVSLCFIGFAVKMLLG